MNTNQTHQIRTVILATVVAFAACASTAGPAFAGHLHGQAEGGSVSTAIGPYAQPLTALDGMTLAQYVSDHQAGDARTATVV